jgi:hypothetical protein
MKIQAGDVLRFKQYYMSSDKRNPIIHESEVLWGLATCSDEFKIIVDATSPRIIERINNYDGFHNNNRIHDDFAIYIGEDRFTVVPPEKWPDEICAFMAKRALLEDE